MTSSELWNEEEERVNFAKWTWKRLVACLQNVFAVLIAVICLKLFIIRMFAELTKISTRNYIFFSSENMKNVRTTMTQWVIAANSSEHRYWLLPGKPVSGNPGYASDSPILPPFLLIHAIRDKWLRGKNYATSQLNRKF